MPPEAEMRELPSVRHHCRNPSADAGQEYEMHHRDIHQQLPRLHAEPQALQQPSPLLWQLAMTDFYTELRKAELHVHLEGSVRSETLLQLNPSLTVEEVRRNYEHTDFAGFIRSYVWVNRQLQTSEHYGFITRCLLEELQRENVSYAEINLSVGVILWKEQPFYDIFDAISAAAEESTVDVYWNFDAVRQFGADPARRVAKLAVEL